MTESERIRELMPVNLFGDAAVLVGTAAADSETLPSKRRVPRRLPRRLINIFRYTDEGRLVEEWVQTDTYDFLRQLGAVGG